MPSKSDMTANRKADETFSNRREQWQEFLQRNNMLPLLATIVSVVLAFGAIQGRTTQNSDDIRDLKRWREEDHNLLKDVQGDVKSIRATVEKK